MARLCERPGCSDPADVTYGIDAATLLVWLDVFGGQRVARSGVLCRRHADAMVVPLGWMLDDRREAVPRLFRSPAAEATPRRRRKPRHEHPTDDAEQLRLDAPAGTMEPACSPDADLAGADLAGEDTAAEGVAAWQPLFDQHDDLSGLLRTTTSLLSRAFNGTPREER